MGYRNWAAFWPIIALGLPVLELVGIYGVWGLLGWGTLLWLLLAAISGVWLISLERATFMPRLAQAMLAGGQPFDLLKNSGQRFLAGVLLLLPGALSDLLAVLLLLNSWRTAPASPTTGPARETPSRKKGGEVIDGDWHRLD